MAKGSARQNGPNNDPNGLEMCCNGCHVGLCGLGWGRLEGGIISVTGCLARRLAFPAKGQPLDAH